MIILPIGPDQPSRPPDAPVSQPAALQTTLKLLVFGFTRAERELIHGIVALSQRRSLRLELGSSAADAETADVILLDGADPKVMAWAARTARLTGKTVLQVDGTPLPGTIHLQRPVPWPKLPSLLQQTLETGSPTSARQPLSTF